MQQHKWIMKKYTPAAYIPKRSIITLLEENNPIVDSYPEFKEIVKRRSYLEVPDYQSIFDPKLPKNDCGFYDATKEIIEHLSFGGNILVYGDYDVDGMTSTAVLYLAFQIAVHNKERVQYFIPDRIKHGYGIDVASVCSICDPGTLIITVDCGTNDTDAIHELLSKGYKVIVTDHHLQEASELPKVTIVNPKIKVDPTHKEYMMPGVYVAGRLAVMLLVQMNIIDSLRKNEEGDKLISAYLRHCNILVAFGIVSDIIELNSLAANLLRYGLSLLNSQECSTGISALLKSCSAKDGQEYTSIFLAYSVIPKLNAAGRMGQIKAAMDVLFMIEGNIDEALGNANLLKQINLDRKQLENDIMVRAKSDAVALKEQYPHGLVLYNEHWYPGVLGIVASRILDEFTVPIIVLTKEGDVLKGSGRSIPSIDLHGAVSQCSDCIDTYGGHKVAIGIQLQENKLEEFRNRFNTAISLQETAEHCVEIDAEVSIDLLLDVRFQILLTTFEPFGNTNPELTLLLRKVTIVVIEDKGDVTTMVLKDQNELTLTTTKYKAPAEWKNLLYAQVDILVSPAYNFYSGTTVMEYKIQHIKLTGEENNVAG